MSESEPPPLVPPGQEAGNTTAKLRDYYPQIEALRKRGHTRAFIIERLAERGVVVNEAYLSTFLTRERRAAKKAAMVATVPAPQAPPLTVVTPIPGPSVMVAPRPPPAPASGASSPPLSCGISQMLDPKARSAFADQFGSKRRSVLGRPSQGENE